MTVRVIAFARIRELLGASESLLTLPNAACVRDAWSALAQRTPALRELSPSTRIARNGLLVPRDERLQDGDEIALLPPSGGG
jgi:molybdopterin converting factor small subunit